MNSLVSYGVSSDSEEEAEDVNIGRTCSQEDDAMVKKTRNFLLESGSASSDSDPDPEPSSSSSSPPPPASSAPPVGSPAANRLPSPSLHASSDISVFANPFRARAEQKLSALQKHVPLTTQARPSQIGGRRVCVSYRKDGRCRFGIKCKFAHDSDLQNPVHLSDPHPDASEETSAPSAGGGPQSLQQESSKEPEQQQMKKRRVGLSNSLIPPKRSLKQYAVQRELERIDMS